MGTLEIWFIHPNAVFLLLLLLLVLLQGFALTASMPKPKIATSRQVKKQANGLFQSTGVDGDPDSKVFNLSLPPLQPAAFK